MGVVAGGSLTPGDQAAHLVVAVRQLAAIHTLDDIVDIVRHAARQLVGADGATFVLRDGDACRYVDEDAISPLWKGKSFPMVDCVTGWAMIHHEPVAIEDIYADDRVLHAAYRPTFVQSLAVVPIRAHEPVGAIGAYWATRRRPTENEIELLQALADSTSVAIDNVRLYNDLEARVSARTEALSAANEELRLLTAGVAHDIRSPLFAVRGLAELLATNFSDELSPAGRRATAALRASAAGLSAFVEELLDYLAAGDRATEHSDVSVAALVDDVRRRLEGTISGRGATITLHGDPHINGDRVLLGQALQNLTSNAIAYTPDGRAPVITIDVIGGADDWELRVSDNGPGIAPDERDDVVLPFRRGRAAKNRHGSGFGLALCRKVAERHGGTLVISDGPEGGATITIAVHNAADAGIVSLRPA
jgi:signal transduction histidine kinase